MYIKCNGIGETEILHGNAASTFTFMYMHAKAITKTAFIIQANCAKYTF